MSSLQDKICNGLTLVGLLSVIGWGTASLWPDGDREAEGDSADTESVEGLDQTGQDHAVLLETVEEAPMVDDPHRADPERESAAMADSSSLEAEPESAVSDSLAAAHHAVPATRKDTASASHPHPKGKADKPKVEKTEAVHRQHATDSIK